MHARRPDGSDLQVRYDFLIVAAGVQQSYFGHAEYAAHAPGMKSIDDALVIRRRVYQAFETAETLPTAEQRRPWWTFALVGAGPTGAATATLRRLGVELHTGTRATRTRPLNGQRTGSPESLLHDRILHVRPAPCRAGDRGRRGHGSARAARLGGSRRRSSASGCSRNLAGRRRIAGIGSPRRRVCGFARGRPSRVGVEQRVGRLVGAVVRPVGWALSAPRVAAGVAGSALQTARAAQTAVTQAVEVLPGLARLSARAERLLDVLTPPVLRVGTQLDDVLVDDLLLAARAAPGLVLAMQQAVSGFDTFLARADGVRDAAAGVAGQADELTAQIARVLGSLAGLVEVADAAVGSAAATSQRAARAVTDVEAVTGRAAGAVVAAEGVVEGGRAVLADAQRAVTGAADIVEVAGAVARQARQIAGTVEGLAGQAGPVVELGVELAGRAAEPARTVLTAATAAAPAVADLTPDLVAVLAEFVERLPDLLHSLDTQVLPMLRELQRTPRDVRALKDSVEGIEPKLGDMEAELAGLPGAKLLRRRGRRSSQELPDGVLPSEPKFDGAPPAAAGPVTDEETRT